LQKNQLQARLEAQHETSAIHDEGAQNELKAEVKRLVADLTVVRQEKLIVDAEIESCKEQLAHRNSVLERLLKELEACTRQLADTKMQAAEADRRLEAHKSSREALQDALQEMQAELDSRKDEVALLRELLSSRHGPLSSRETPLAQDADELRDSLSVLQNIIDELEQKLQQAEAEKDVLARQLQIMVVQEEQAWDSRKQDESAEEAWAQELAIVRKQRADDLEHLLRLQHEREEELEQFLAQQQELERVKALLNEGSRRTMEGRADKSAKVSPRSVHLI